MTEQNVWILRYAGYLRHSSGQKGGLVITPFCESCSVERNRNDHVCLWPKTSAGAGELMAKTTQIHRSAAMFKGENKRAAIFVILKGRAGFVEIRRVGHTFHTKRPGPSVIGKRKSAAIAARIVQMAHMGPDMLIIIMGERSGRRQNNVDELRCRPAKSRGLPI